MRADETRALTQQLIGLFYDVYNELGHGFLESIYQKAYSLALHEAEIRAAISD